MAPLPQQQHKDETTTLFFLFGIILLLGSISWALQGGEFAPVMDCDETFNYLEAAHYSLHGTGMQTWEYAAQYGLRSWFYIELHLLPLRVVGLVVELTKMQQVLLLRTLLVVLSCWFESMLAKAVGNQFKSRKAALLTAMVLGSSAGMGHARRSLLPSSTCMMCFTLAQALWMENRPRAALYVGSFSVLVCWPFSALPFVPIGLQVLMMDRGFKVICEVVVVSLFAFGLFPALVDSYFYGKPISAAVQMVLYNALGSSGGGAHLYGVEEWTFYFKNLVLNFNLVVPLSFAGAFFSQQASVQKFHSLAFLLAFGLFQSMPHKEERFLYMLYPTLCWSCAVLVAPYKKLTVLFLCVFLPLSISRNMALGRLTAPTEVYARGFSTQQNQGVLCLGREWHRFPSSFYLPVNITLQWTQSEFRGILPQSFAAKEDLGYSRIVPHMNDLNKEESTRYVRDLSQCTFTVDLNEAYTSRDALRPFTDTKWEKMHCAKFANLESTKQPFRSFALLFDPWSGVQTINYCIFKRA